MKDRFIFILTHGRWGEELKKSTEMVCGEIANCRAYGLMPEDDEDEFMEKIQEEIQREQIERPIFLSDLRGGSSSHAAAYLAYKNRGIALSGLNLAMLACVSENRGMEDEELIRKILEEGRAEIQDIRPQL